MGMTPVLFIPPLMNPDQLPTVSTFRVDKPGKSKFAPSIGGRKSQSAVASSSSATMSATSTTVPANSTTVSVSVTTTPTSSTLLSTPSEIVDSEETTEPDSNESVPIIGKKIESIQSRRLAHKEEPLVHSNSSSHTQQQQQQQQIKLPSGPKDAASIATSTSQTTTSEKRTMSYFLKDSGEGREMPGNQLNSATTTADPSLSPSKTRRIVNLRNIKAPPRSAASSTALAPQVRVVDGAIVYDEKFSAAINLKNSSISDLEQELEYIDEDDENGKHLTSATYSTKAKGSNRWNPAETEIFYEALSMCGTDFSMIQTLIPHRTRAQIKGKYKLEEKSNPARINNSLKNRKSFDPNNFNKEQ